MKAGMIYLWLLLVCINGNVIAQDVSPVVFVMNAKILQQNKSRIKSNDSKLMPSFRQLLAEADKALQFKPVSVMEKKNTSPSGNMHDYTSLAVYYWPDPSKPDGIPYIRKDGEINPETKEYEDKQHLNSICSKVPTLALAYFFSDDVRYATHAAKLLRVWFLDSATKMNPNLNFAQAIKGKNDGRGIGIIDSRDLMKIADAIGLLKGSASWSKADDDGMQLWFSQYLEWMLTSKNGIEEMNAKNNHGVWYDAQVLSYALFTNHAELAKTIVARVQNRLEMQMDSDGNFPAEMERTISLHYTVFTMYSLFMIAEMSNATGVDFWHYKSPSGKSLQKGFEALCPYITREKNWAGQQIKEFDYSNALPILSEGIQKFNCKKCVDAIASIAVKESDQWPVHLLTNIDL